MSQNPLDPDAIKEELRGIVDPCSDARGIGNDIVEMGLVESVDVDGRDLTIHLRITAPTCHMIGYFVEEIEGRLESNPDVSSITVLADSGLNWSPDFMEENARNRREAYLDQFRRA